MKLILAIIQNDNSEAVTSALIREGFFVTRMSSTGGFLTVKNETLLIGTDEEKIDTVKDILKKQCTLSQQASPDIGLFGKGMSGEPDGLGNGGAVMFVLNVDKFEKI